MLACIGQDLPPEALTKNDAPAHVLSNYNLAFEDVFKGQTQLNPAKWNTELIWGSDLTINREEQYYVDTQDPDETQPSPFSFNAAGNLVITAAPIQGDGPVTENGLDGGQNYTSGIIHTRDSMSFTHGYAEVCAKTPCTTAGAWPATWLLNSQYYGSAFSKNLAERGDGSLGNDKFNPEIDFMEQVSGPNYEGSECTKNAYHYYTGTRDTDNYYLWSLDGGNFRQVDATNGGLASQFNLNVGCDGSFSSTIPDDCSVNFCQDFHTYAVDWTPEYIHYYIDGRIVNCVQGADIVSDQAMYLLINVAVGGSFPFGNPPSQLADPNEYPISMEVEYARIYQHV